MTSPAHNAAEAAEIAPQDAIDCPFTIGVDSREQHPYKFRGLTANADKKHAPITVHTSPMTLSTGWGDYTIVELPKIAIERKSKEDLYGSIGQRRENFEDRLLRMGGMSCVWYAAVVVEAEISELIAEPPAHSRLNPKSLLRTILAWQMRYPMVMWWFLPNRAAAEAFTFRLMERFWAIYSDRIPDLSAAAKRGVDYGHPDAAMVPFKAVPDSSVAGMMAAAQRDLCLGKNDA